MSAARKLAPDEMPRKLPIVPAANQGAVEDFESLLGEGNDLWASDAEFEAFLTELRRWRQPDADESRPS
jgi:hypothetical protein